MNELSPTTSGPIVALDGTQRWYQSECLHRENDQPAIIRYDGYKEWWVKGELHRDGDEPAIIHSDKKKEWWVKGEQHRLKGAAVIGIYTEKLNRWYLYGKKTTEHQHKVFIKQIASEGQGLEQFQSLPYEYQKNVFIALLNED